MLLLPVCVCLEPGVDTRDRTFELVKKKKKKNSVESRAAELNLFQWFTE